MSIKHQQSPSTILMVRPKNFGFNPQTAASNAFQTKLGHLSETEIQQRALREFDTFVATLRVSGVEVIVYNEDFHPDRRDAIFPNNWVSFHEDGRVFLYPMESPNRRLERNTEIIEILRDNFEIKTVNDLTYWEQRGKFLEGTGSIIFDHEHNYAYACKSSRTDESIFRHVCAMLLMEPMVFDAVDVSGKPIYHTNVMLTIGSGYAVICLSSIIDLVERKNVVRSLEVNGHEIVDIDFRQLSLFAGNMLEVQSRTGHKKLVMSQTAFNSLTDHQIDTLQKYVEIVPVLIPTIEQIGGGSARCMMAGIHLPKKATA